MSYAPVTEKHVDGTMNIGVLCLASIDQSDNTAAHLVIKSPGGPNAVTSSLRGFGDPISRLHRYEPDLSLAKKDDLRDTTTPQAMADLLETCCWPRLPEGFANHALSASKQIVSAPRCFSALLQARQCWSCKGC